MSFPLPTELLGWLPPLCTLDQYNGAFQEYLDAVYELFCDDWIWNNKPSLNGIRFGLKRYPVVQNKEAVFWHLISEGKIESDRTPDLRRCERICWPRAMIEAVGQTDDRGNPKVVWWRNSRQNKSGVREDRIIVALPDFSYVIVISDRTEYMLLWTAYCCEHEHRRAKARKEHDAFWATQK